jgi:hypothetical protein
MRLEAAGGNKCRLFNSTTLKIDISMIKIYIYISICIFFHIEYKINRIKDIFIIYIDFIFTRN